MLELLIWKYYIGQSKGLKRMKVYDKKVDIENQFTDWINSGDEERYANWKCSKYDRETYEK